MKIDIQFSFGKDVSDADVKRIKRNVEKAIERTVPTLIVNEIEVEFYD